MRKQGLETEVIGSVPLPDGEYKAFWGGYELTLLEEAEVHCRGEMTGTMPLRFRTKDGVRTPRMPAVVTVKDKKGTVREKRP